MSGLAPGGYLVQPWAGVLVTRALRSRVLRLALAVAGVAVSTLLVLMLAAGYRGLTAGVESYVGQERIDLWVTPAGTDNLIRSSGLLPMALVNSIRRVDGVALADPVLRGFVAVTSARRTRPLSLLAMGCRAPGGLGMPPHVVTGHAPERSREATLDHAAAHRLGVRVGDSISINGRPFGVAGLSAGTNHLATQFLFLDGPSAEQAAGVTGQASFVAVKVAAGADADSVRLRIAGLYRDAQVFDRAEWTRNNVAEVAAGFLPLLVLISVVGTVSATLLVALLVQSVVDDRRRDIAVLLALGAPAGVVARSVVLQAILMVVAGTLVGGGLTLVLWAALKATTPLVELAPRFTDLVWVTAVFGLASQSAALAPLLRLRRIDPAEAFRP